MKEFFRKLTYLLTDSSVQKKIIFTVAALVVFRFLATIPVPGINSSLIQNFLAENEFFGFLNIISGGGLSNLSIMMLGVGPYITASIIMQLMTLIFPQMKSLMNEEGEAGRQKFSQYSRFLTVPLAILQGYGLLTLLERSGVIPELSGETLILNIFIVTAGAVFLMWLGELISEFGIGNGISMVVFASIVAGFPTTVARLYQSYDPSQVIIYIGVGGLALAILYAVVYVTEAERPVPVTYASQARAGRRTPGGSVDTYVPLRVISAGVIPIIFAVSLLVFPQLLASVLLSIGGGTLTTIAEFLNNMFANTYVYATVYFLLVVFFTYFYTGIVTDPHKITENLQKGGGFVPGLRPGNQTEEHFSSVLSRLTFFSALFLGVVAIIPVVLQAVTNRPELAVGGTAILIVVSVVLDLIKKLDAQASAQEYTV